MLGQIVIVAYRPHEGKEEQLLDLVRQHLPVLREQGLATERQPVVMRAGNGVLVEIFEWKSAAAVEEAHANAAVQSLWDKFSKVCDYEVLANLPECQRPFSPFEPVDL